MSQSSFNHDVDLIDTLVGLQVGSNTYAARHFRDEVLTGTQESYEAIFNEELTLALSTRWLVALYASQLSNAKELSEHYLEQANRANTDEISLQAVLNDDLSLLTNTALKSILIFTRTLILNPLKGDRDALLALKNAGISTPDCITVAQLIAFLSYQIRLVAGLKAMKSLEEK